MQEFDVEIRDRSGSTNQVADHLSRLPHLKATMVNSNPTIPCDSFPDEALCAISSKPPWYASFANYIECGVLPPCASRFAIEKLKRESRFYIWEPPLMWKICSDKVIRRCVDDVDVPSILEFCHSHACGGHFSSNKTARKVLDCGLYWPSLFKDSYEFCKACLKCQKVSSWGKRHEMPQQPILFCEIFDVWGIDFMGPFPPSFTTRLTLSAIIMNDESMKKNRTVEKTVTVEQLDDFLLEVPPAPYSPQVEPYSDPNPDLFVGDLLERSLQ
ncbi:uncharacterized protein LOC129286523 [Prosopis cineraria]|uniref:uncharacterized protein LOC129286523 n=1 Tax=Prosopis cineraria TaxID=364024 RepID=UPI0024105120|nr:uncharacterized protein LOC129286523 [Prosopis cineraria]